MELLSTVTPSRLQKLPHRQGLEQILAIVSYLASHLKQHKEESILYVENVTTWNNF